MSEELEKAIREQGFEYGGRRMPICDPQGRRIEMFVVYVGHPHAPWEAVYCKAEYIAKYLVELKNTSPAQPDAVMPEAKRYEPTGVKPVMEVWANGKYVLYSDYRALQRFIREGK